MNSEYLGSCILHINASGRYIFMLFISVFYIQRMTQNKQLTHASYLRDFVIKFQTVSETNNERKNKKL